MTNERLLRLAEALGLDMSEFRIKLDRGIQINMYRASEWSLDGPDLGNVAAVVAERLVDLGFVVDTSQGVWDDKLHHMVRIIRWAESDDLSGYQEWEAFEDNTQMALVEAACRALGVEG